MDMVRRIAPTLLALTVLACGADTRQAGDGTGSDALPLPPEATGTNGSNGSGTAPRADDDRGAILFLGTSLTAGYGLGAEYAYPAVIQQKLDSAGLPFRVINAGMSGETAEGGLRRLEWSLQRPIDVLVLELGANDGLRGRRISVMRAALDSIITRTKRRYPDASIVVTGMEAPPNLGSTYTTRFREVFAELATKHDAAFVPFLLEGVGGRPEMNQADGMHPNAEGQRVIARNVWEVLLPVLKKRANGS